MARIIDKEEKRCDIALSAINLFCEKGIQQTSIDEIAKSAGVAKGTIYLYFKNKEEIVFAIWDVIAGRHREAFAKRVRADMSAKEKILEFLRANKLEANPKLNLGQLQGELFDEFVELMENFKK